MFTRKTQTPSDLQVVIAKLSEDMVNVDAFSPEYAAMADSMVKLQKAREHDNRKRLSPDTLAVVVGNLAGIVMIVGHERAHVVTSKAIQFVLKAAK